MPRYREEWEPQVVTEPADTTRQSHLSERFSVPGAEILSEDTWADEPESCPNCGGAVDPGRAQCPGCGQWLERCGRTCPSCASPRCVGGGRANSSE